MPEPSHNVEATLPLLRPRSGVYWPRRDHVQGPEVAALRDLFAMTPAPRVALLGAAVACVLARYTGAEVVPLGVLDQLHALRRLVVPVSPGASVGDVAAALRHALAQRVEPGEAELPFQVLVADGAHGDVLPDARQDVNVMLRTDGGSLACDYNSRLFYRETASRFLGHVARFLECRGPDQRVGDVQYLAAEELTAIEAATCHPGAPDHGGTTIQHLFAAAARAHCDATAVEHAGRSLSYRELDAWTDRIAAGLAERGATVGVRVGIAFRPGIDQVASLLAVLKTGATAVPLDHTFPARRQQAIIGAAGLVLLLTEQALAGQYKGSAKVVLLSETVSDDVAGGVTGDEGDIVYVLFTSGSTGAPKGVELRQRTLVNLVRWQDEATPACGLRTLSRSSIAFDVGFQEIFATLCFGGTLVVASGQDRADVSALQGLIRGGRIGRLFAPPVLLVQLAEMSQRTDDLTSLRFVIVAGEQLKITPAIVRLFRSCPAVVINQYGPTETHVATSHTLQGPSLRWPILPPIGRPIANARIHVLDVSGHRCPVGVVGEIAVGGILPAMGYLNDPESTARRFVPDRFPGARADGTMYLTGDLGRLGRDGELEFLGRRDDQVKLRGYRIELGDIEAHAMAMPGVQLAAAALRTRSANSDPFVALFVQPAAGATLDGRDVRAFLADRLPQHMLPGLGAISSVARLPLNTNGKVDRLHLPKIVTEDADAGTGEAGGVPERIAAIWRRALGVARIGPDDEFHMLGGHSLIAIQIVSDTNEAFGISVPLANLLQGGTLHRFTARVQGLLAARSGQAPDPAGTAAPEETEQLHDVTLRNGTVVCAPYPAEAHHYHLEIHERVAYLRHGILIPQDGVVIDAGANIGLFTRLVLDRSANASVIAIEPSPLLARALSRNTDHARGRVEVIEAGLGSTDGTAEFTYYPALTGMSSFFPDGKVDRALLAGLLANARSSDAAVEEGLAAVEDSYLEGRLRSRRMQRPVRRLSGILASRGVGCVDLLKIDVQHGETAVLDGIDVGDWSKIRQLVIEYQIDHARNAGIAERLSAAGFRVVTEGDAMHAGTDVVYTYAVRTT